MSVLIKHMAMPEGCIYANDKDQTDYCPMLNHDDVPFCQYIENEPESAIGIDERPVYCPLSDVPDTNVGDIISRQAAIETVMECYDNDELFEVYEDKLRELPPANCSEFPNSSDTISRQQATDTLRGYLVGKRCPDDGTLTCRLIENEVINKLPSAQPKKGRWISADAMFHGVPFYCSECGENTRDTVMGKPRWKFCPMCGSYNGGENDE